MVRSRAGHRSMLRREEVIPDFDACWDGENADYDYLRQNAPRLLSILI